MAQYTPQQETSTATTRLAKSCVASAAFEQLMQGHQGFQNMLEPVGHLTANGVSFPNEVSAAVSSTAPCTATMKTPNFGQSPTIPFFNLPAAKVETTGKTQQDIAREKAIQQLQVQCLMKGGDAILGLTCEFTAKPRLGCVICTASGTAVRYKH